jgi:hypothetical protein
MPGLKQIHPSERLIIPGGEATDIDVEMVPLMRRLWAMGLVTNGCCQDFGESIARNGHGSTTTDDDRERLATFFKGRAWLKMPTGDAIRLIGMIKGDPRLGQLLGRWTHPEAWMNIVYILPNAQNGAALAATAQLHFPVLHIPELIAALGDG